MATCRWGPHAEQAIRGIEPRVTQIDFRQYLDIAVEEQDRERPVTQPWPLQTEAINDVVEGLGNHDRGRLVMACGTGKTFTSLRIAERIVEDGEHILFAAPSIALVSQARREWLRHTCRKLRSIVVCSDSTAGGRQENEDIRLTELECPVSTDPSVIAQSLRGEGPTRVVFCTYQSLGKVTQAQQQHGAPMFNLAIADEAHRTTGALSRDDGSLKDVDFQQFHDDARLRAKKRLYMTATPRIYTGRSRIRQAQKGIHVVDMSDVDVYGPELHRLPFKKAVENDILSDYRVIVLGVSRANVTPKLRRRLERLYTSGSRRGAPTSSEMTRVLGVSLAINGVTEGSWPEQPGRLPRTIAYANSIARSGWYAKALTDRQVLSATTRRMEAGQRAMKVVAQHLDASSSALQRNKELRALAKADRAGECRVVCNVKLFTEGVDVPELSAVAFLDPRRSHVDVVQAVGRVMRKAPKKNFGYIIVPVVVDPEGDIFSALESGTEGYETVGKVLRALQSHDGRLAECLADFLHVYETKQPPSDNGGDDLGEQLEFDLEEVGQGIYAHVATASGLGKQGKLVADEITDSVRHVSAVFQKEKLEPTLAKALDLVSEDAGGAEGVCTVAALMLCNACLLHRRLHDEPGVEVLMRLSNVTGSRNPRAALAKAWRAILRKDYRPVFEPALEVVTALHEGKTIDGAICLLAECANRVADTLSDLGYDHAGPLYHRILGSARSDGAFYTNNLSAIMLAHLVLSKNLVDWSDIESVAKLRIMDPACGTGTLLMAAIQTIKSRVAASLSANGDKERVLHKRLVEEVFCGLDINPHGIQLAACNMTLGAPTVDYERMNLVTMPHGPQATGATKAGSLEILMALDDELDLRSFMAPRRALGDLDAVQVNESASITFPLEDIDVVIMNAPYTADKHRSRKYGEAGAKSMQRREKSIKAELQTIDQLAGDVVTARSIRTFFTPLAEMLLKSNNGYLAKVMPATACTSASGQAERRFLADRFHVETIVTSHDPQRINFSENTGIHECLIVCRRHPVVNRPPTSFVALCRMPESAEEAIEAAAALESRQPGRWGTYHQWSANRMLAGDWSPAQWCNGTFAEIVRALEDDEQLEPIAFQCRVGPSGRSIYDAYKFSSGDVSEAIPGFHSVSSKLRRTMLASPEAWYVPKDGKETAAERCRSKRSQFLIAERFDTLSGRLTGIWTEQRSFGNRWVPVSVDNVDQAKALAVWWNSTPARMLLLNRRTRKLTYPTWSLSHLREVRIPKPDNPGWSALRAAFEEACELEMLPMKQATECEVRQVIDKAAAHVLNMDYSTLAEWQRKLELEPTISNKPYPLEE